MTEKRFTHKKWYDDRQLFDGDEPFAIVDVYIQAKEICNKLNELHEENEQLKKEIKGFESCSHNWGLLYDEAKNKVEELSEENKTLKSLLNNMADKNGEIWLNDGKIFRLKKIFKGEWVK